MTGRRNRRLERVEARPHKMYRLVAMGGTFDVLHRGHRKLLRRAFTVGLEVIIGITGDEFAKTLHKPHKLDSYAKRKRDVERLLTRWHVLARAEIVPLHDRYGPTVRRPGIQALVVSRRTLATAYEINQKRRARGLKPLVVDPIDLIMAEDERVISSTRIRRGRIDREGKLL